MNLQSKSRWQQFAMLAPAILGLSLIVIIPFILSIWFSFTDQRLVPRPIPTQVLGFRNY